MGITWLLTRGVAGTSMWTIQGAHICTQLYREGGGDMESWLDMHICTDARPYSNKGMRPEEG